MTKTFTFTTETTDNRYNVRVRPIETAMPYTKEDAKWSAKFFANGNDDIESGRYRYSVVKNMDYGVGLKLWFVAMVNTRTRTVVGYL